MYGYFTLLGRLLLGGLFIGSAVGMITDPGGTQYFMAMYGMPFTGFFMWATVAILLVTATCLILGWQTRWAALALAAWLVPVTFVFHGNWSDPVQCHAFMENIGLIGALILTSGVGAGAFSLDARLKVDAAGPRGVAVSLPDAGLGQALLPDAGLGQALHRLDNRGRPHKLLGEV
jgi:putative oxidoreductase